MEKKRVVPRLGSLVPLALMSVSFVAVCKADSNPNTASRTEAGVRETPSETPRNLDTHHLFHAPSTRGEWENRRRVLRQQILFSAGLLPMPKKTPLNPRFTGRIDGGDFTVENVAIETLPGFYLCGNLYRPKGRSGHCPGIVNPHGHWVNGRLEMQPDVPRAAPAPAAPALGRGNLVSIGVNLARQGFVVFAYDAVGYNDTSQVDHTFANSIRPWIWNVSLMGLQLWNSIRVVDFLQSLPDVDKDRIGATGASGGGSQTFLLTAVDDRIKAAVPVNMVSAYMQGGCLCENGPGLRVDTDNVEVAALFAPKPMLLVACTGDWTSKNPSEEWPAVHHVYELYGVGERTEVKQFNYQHNYNVESREAMYAWFGKWLMKDSDASHFKERPFGLETAAMHVWNAKTPMPSDALDEAKLTEAIIDRGKSEIAALWPQTESGLDKFRAAMQPALECSLDARWPASMPFESRSGAKKIALVVAEASDSEAAAEAVSALRSAGYSAEAVTVKPPDANPETMWGSYYSCYNATPAGLETQKLVSLIARRAVPADARVDVVGIGRAGRLCLLARSLTPNVGKVVADVAQLDSRDDAPFLNELFAPGLRRAGDLQTAAMLIAPASLYIHNTGGRFTTEPISAGYSAVGADLRADLNKADIREVVKWLTQEPPGPQ